MNEWMNEFLTRCLEGVPPGKYRDRTEAELRDHLLALSRDLEGAGYSAGEARSLTQARMGDPAELSRRYVREWRRRTLGQRSLIVLELLLVGAAMVIMGYLYIFNTRNFGKALVAWWGIAAILAAGLLLCSFAARSWTLARWSSCIICVIQLPPVFCWIAFSGVIGFEMSGVMVPGWMGLLIHLLFFAWGAGNYYIATGSQPTENTPSKAQSA